MKLSPSWKLSILLGLSLAIYFYLLLSLWGIVVGFTGVGQGPQTSEVARQLGADSQTAGAMARAIRRQLLVTNIPVGILLAITTPISTRLWLRQYRELEQPRQRRRAVLIAILLGLPALYIVGIPVALVHVGATFGWDALFPSSIE